MVEVFVVEATLKRFGGCLWIAQDYVIKTKVETE